MKVLINRHVVKGPWGGGNLFVQAFRDVMPKLGHQVVDWLTDSPDVVLLAGIDADGLGVSAETAFAYRDAQLRAGHDCRVVLRVNDCDARKGTLGVDELLWHAAQRCDSVVFVSKWLRDHMIESWSKIPELRRHAHVKRTLYTITQHVSVVHNGVDHGLFHPVSFEEKSRLRIVAHHWSDNPMKGKDVYEALDQLPWVEFTYIGRHQCEFKNPITKVLPPMTGEPLARALAQNRVYVSGSRWDPGPNHVLEALACGLATWVHRDGGGAVEFAGQDHTYGSIDELKSIVLNGVAARRAGVPSPCTSNAYNTISWDECIAQYAETLERKN